MRSEIAESLEKAVGQVCKEWAKAKRKKERIDRQERNWLGSRATARTSVRAAAFKVMDQAYAHASSNGKYLAVARQIMYAARPKVLELTEGKCWKDSAYFTQTILKDYIEEKSPCWADEVVWDARGHVTEPHTGGAIGLGGAAVRKYVHEWAKGEVEIAPLPPVGSPQIETMGPRNRFGAVLFIEKEGFNEILTHAGIAERYDLAIMSTKGIPVAAACDLVGQFNHAGVLVYVLHDFDRDGFKIVKTLSEGTRLSYGGDVIDLGLRLEDIEGLQSEGVVYSQQSSPDWHLRTCGATGEEIAFLVGGPTRGGWAGKRVELNAMTSEQLIVFIERKLEEHGVSKVIPDWVTLANAYRRALRLKAWERAIDEMKKDLKEPEQDPTPENLVDRVKEVLEEDPSLSWDEAVWEVMEAEESPDAPGEDVST